MQGPDPVKARLTSKKFKHLKLNMTQQGFNTDAYDAMAKAYSDDERETKHRVIANAKGQCTDAYIGKVLEIPRSVMVVHNPARLESKLIWTMDDSGNLYIDMSDNHGGIFHSTMMGGYRPVAAGEILIERGYITMLNEESGHYAPSHRLEMVVNELKEQGFKFPKVTLANSKHDNVLPRVDKTVVRRGLIEREQLAAGLKKEKWDQK